VGASRRIRGGAMVTVEAFSRLVSGIYAAAVTPEHWESALEEIRRTLGGTIGTLIESAGGAWTIQATTAPAEVGKAYAEHYYRLDYVLAGVENGPAGVVRTGTELIAARTNKEFYNDWMRPNGIEDGLFVGLTGGQSLSCLIVASPRRSESFDTLERLKLLNGLVPHLQQTLRTQNKLAAVAQSKVDLVRALEAIRHGIIIVGSGWWVITLNTAAERILRAEDGLKLSSARIAATSVTAEHKLQRSLYAAITDDDSKIRSGRSFVCERPSGKRPYVVHVLPLRRGATDETRTEAKALVLILDPDQGSEPAASLLGRLYGLTVAEADVAVRIARGANLKEISDGLSVSITTVRKHLQHVYDKTDTHRQAELVRLLLTLRP
jgi:DNA-binding CsgD family transcriptional regulator